MDEDNFCDECCNFSSGVNFSPEIASCGDKCDSAIKSKIEPEMTVSMQFTKGSRKDPKENINQLYARANNGNNIKKRRLRKMRKI